MEIRLAGGGGRGAGDWRWVLVARAGVLLAKPDRRCTVSDGHGLRWIGAGGCGVARWPFCGVLVEPGWTDGRLGDAGRFGGVPQPDSRECSGDGESLDTDAGVLA